MGGLGAGLLVFPPTTSALRGMESVLSGCLRCTEGDRRDRPRQRRCVASGGSWWPLGLLCTGVENKMPPCPPYPCPR